MIAPSQHWNEQLQKQGGALAMAAQVRPTQIVSDHACFQVLGVRIDALQISDVVAQMEEWIHDRGGCHSIAATGMHGTVEAQHDPSFKEALDAATGIFFMAASRTCPSVWRIRSSAGSQQWKFAEPFRHPSVRLVQRKTKKL